MVKAQVTAEDRGSVDQPCTERALGESRRERSTARSIVQKTSCGFAQLAVDRSVDRTEYNLTTTKERSTARSTTRHVLVGFYYDSDFVSYPISDVLLSFLQEFPDYIYRGVLSPLIVACNC